MKDEYDRRNQFILHPSSFILLSLVLAAPALACWDCIQQELGVRWTPAVLARTSKGVRVRLMQTKPPYEVADLYIEDDQQRFIKPADQPEAKQRPTERAIAAERCRRLVPYHALDRKTAVELRPHLRVGYEEDEDVGPCVEQNGVLWFGLTFYEGEGSDGVGGIGRYDLATKKMEVRRPLWLRDKSIDALAYDGRLLWFSASQHFEHGGPSYGLVRYDWERDELQPMRGDDVPCMGAGDVMWDGASLWVSNSLVVSQLDSATHQWTHYTFGEGRLMKTDCHRFNQRLLDISAAHFNRGTGCSTFCEDDQVPVVVARYDPAFVRDYLLAKPAKEWNEGELQAFGSLTRGFGELKHVVLDHVSDARRLTLVLNAFADRKDKSEAWRDHASTFARQTEDLYPLRYFRGDVKVFDFLAAFAQGNSRTSYEALEMLPWIDSQRAIPVALQVANRLSPEEKRGFVEDILYSTAIEALERAAHLRIEADGSRTPLAANSDTPEYADEEDGAFQRNSHRDGAKTLRKIVELWNEWARERK